MANQIKLDSRIVYLLENEWYKDGLRKVGKTHRMLGRNGRLKSLQGAGVPGKFNIVCALLCHEPGAAKVIEDALHTFWKDKNINDSPTGSQEWFHGITDAEFKAQFSVLVNTSRGRIEWWTEDNDEPFDNDDEQEDELPVSFDEVSSTSPVATPLVASPVVRYDHSLTTVDTYPLLINKEKEAYQQWRRRNQGFSNPLYCDTVKSLNRTKTMQWDDKRLSFVLLRDDYEWLTPELRAVLNDCF